MLNFAHIFKFSFSSILWDWHYSVKYQATQGQVQCPFCWPVDNQNKYSALQGAGTKYYFDKPKNEQMFIEFYIQGNDECTYKTCPRSELRR